MYLASNSLMSEINSFSLNNVTAELKTKFDEFTANSAAQESMSNRVLTVGSSSAEIMVCGMTVKSMNIMAWMMGATAYSEINSAIAAIEADSNITMANFRIDSGGGTVSGLTSCLNAIKAMKTPTKAIVDGVCCSAAYAIAAQCDSIEAISDGEILGSVGVQSESKVDGESIIVRGENSKNKNPDVSTESGLAAKQSEVNDLESVYLESCASGRGVAVQDVIDNYGNGAIMNAKTALERGMIDSIQTKNSTALGNSEQTLTANSGETMNKAELKANHPELFAEIKAEGKTEEQDRVSAFAALGEAAGATELAMAMIADGTEHSAAVNAKFMAAQMKANTLSALAADNVDTSGIDQTNASAQTEAEKLDAETIAAFDGNQVEHF